MDNVREKLVELLEQNEIEFMTYSTDKVIAAAIGDDPVDRFLSRAAFTADFLLSNGVTVQEWIPVTERLPKAAATVLVCHKNGYVTTSAWLGAHWWFKNESNPITHWMPLPQPPKGE